MRKRVKKAICPNCGHKFTGADNYCPSCGQENHTHQLPIRHFVLELMENTVHFDTKFFHTARDLFKPGLLTKNYNENKRARYVPPFRIYIFISAIYFFALSFINPNKIQVGPDVLELSRQENITDSDIEDFLIKNGKSVNLLNKKVMRLIVNLKGGIEAIPDKAMKNISFLMFLLMPFFATLLYLIYFRRKMFYTEHLVFSVHLHTLVFMLLFVSLLISMTGLKLTAAAILGSIAYLFIAVRNVYQETWGVTTLKSIVLVAGYFIMLVAGILAATIASII